MAQKSERFKGSVFAILSSLVSGLAPLYWRLLADVPLATVMAYRVLTACLILGLFLIVFEKRPFEALATPLLRKKTWKIHLATAVLLGVHWSLMVWGVQQGHLFAVSLGNYMIPIVVLIGSAIFFSEKLERSRLLAVTLAMLGVVVLSFGDQGIPWLAIALGLTFGGYSLLRKLNPESSLQSSYIDILLLCVPAIPLIWVSSLNSSLTLGIAQFLLLVGGGLLTAIPVLWLGRAIKRLPMNRMGFFQYISPTIQFVIACVFMNKPFTHLQLVGYGIIWTGIALLLVTSAVGKISGKLGKPRRAKLRRRPLPKIAIPKVSRRRKTKRNAQRA